MIYQLARLSFWIEICSLSSVTPRTLHWQGNVQIQRKKTCFLISRQNGLNFVAPMDAGWSVIIHIIAGKYFIIHIVQIVNRPWLERSKWRKPSISWSGASEASDAAVKSTTNCMLCVITVLRLLSPRGAPVYWAKFSQQIWVNLRNWLERSEWRKRHCKDPAF
jgi:hypothetical protein